MLALSGPGGGATGDPDRTPMEAENDRLAAVCRSISQKLPGIKFDIAVSSGGERAHLVDWADNPDNITGDRRHPIGCLQNSLCGAVLWALASENIINPMSLVGEYLPELKNGGRGPGDLVRVVDLVRHSSGYLSFPASVVTWPDLVDYLLKSGSSFPAGQIINYLGPEQRILSRLIAVVTGRSIWDEVQDRIYRPLDIESYSVENYPTKFGYRKLVDNTETLLKVFQYIFSENGPWGRAFLGDMQRDILSAVRSPQAASTRLPTGYSWGFSHFENGLWGGSGFSGSDGLGLRFDERGDFMVTTAVVGVQLRRDLFLEEICTAYGFRSAQIGRRSPLGAVVELERAALPGIYRSGPDLMTQVFVDGGHLECATLQNGRMIGSVRGFIEDDGTIIGDSRFPGSRIQFYPHPMTGRAAMSFGLLAYVRD